MAIYHLSVKIISRGKGKSAVAAAAYRAAEKITNEYNGITSDYTKKGGVVHTEILLPENAPKEYSDRAVLWNAVEKAERYKIAQLAREVEISLPKELTMEQNLKLVRDYVKRNFVDEDMCADLCIHDKGDGNPHCHIMLTLRSLDENGKWMPKSHTVDGIKIPTNNWSNRANCEIWREDWSNSVNAFLEQNNIAQRVDNRSYKRQGLEQIPTVHLGVAAHQMENRGIKTERGNHNRKVQSLNKELRQIKARIRKLEDWLKAESANAEPPTLYDVISDILGKKSNAVSNLKSAANMLIFLQENNISNVADLERFVGEMHDKRNTVSEKIKPIERRLKTLDEHVEQAEIYKKNKTVYDRYNSIQSGFSDKLFKRDPKADYYENNRAEITLFEAAERYLRDVMQERFDPEKLPPIKKWKAEQAGLIAERDSLYRDYYLLKDEVKVVEGVKRQIDGIMREEQGRNELTKKRGYGLE